MFETRKMRVVAPQSIAVTGTVGQGPNVPCHGVFLKTNGAGTTAFIGISNALTTGNGYPLVDGQELELPIKNLNQLWFIGSAATTVRVLPYFYD